MNTRSPQDKWLHIFIDGSQIDGYINAGIHCELSSCYMPLGQHSTAFEGEIEAIRTALRLLNLLPNKFERAVIFSDSKAAIISAGLTETVTSTETKDCQVLIRQIKAKCKQIVLQWIPGHSQIVGNGYADTLPKKGAKITQTHIRETSYHSIPDGWLEARIRKVLRPAISTQVFLVFLGPRREYWDGSHFSSELPLHASHVALPN